MHNSYMHMKLRGGGGGGGGGGRGGGGRGGRGGRGVSPYLLHTKHFIGSPYMDN